MRTDLLEQPNAPRPEQFGTQAAYLRASLVFLHAQMTPEERETAARRKCLPKTERMEAVGIEIDYHFCAFELAELVGDTEKAADHLEALRDWLERFWRLEKEHDALCGESPPS